MVSQPLNWPWKERDWIISCHFHIIGNLLSLQNMNVVGPNKRMPWIGQPSNQYLLTGWLSESWNLSVRKNAKGYRVESCERDRGRHGGNTKEQKSQSHLWGNFYVYKYIHKNWWLSLRRKTREPRRSNYESSEEWEETGEKTRKRAPGLTEPELGLKSQISLTSTETRENRVPRRNLWGRCVVKSGGSEWISLPQSEISVIPFNLTPSCFLYLDPVYI